MARYFRVQPAYYGYQPLFEDRPRNVGDILTINLQENVSASKTPQRMPTVVENRFSRDITGFACKGGLAVKHRIRY